MVLYPESKHHTHKTLLYLTWLVQMEQRQLGGSYLKLNSTLVKLFLGGNSINQLGETPKN